MAGSAATASIDTMTLTLGPTAPTTTSTDAYYLTGSTTDSTNVGGNLSSNGGYGSTAGGNDQYQYVAGGSGGRPDQGQTFTTGSNATGYTLSNIWVQHVDYTGEVKNYTTDYNGTWWDLPSGAQLTLRITNPGQAGTSNFALASFNYTATGTENAGKVWSGSGSNNTNNPGDGYWLDFALSSPVSLAANTQYGFDLTSTSGNGYFELAGTDTLNAFTGGSAYNGSTAGATDNTLNALQGSRVFVAAMAPNAAVPVPATFSLVAAGGLGLLACGFRRRKIC